MDSLQIDNKGLLYIAPDIDDWDPLEKMDIHVIFDLDDDLDIGVPEIPDQLLSPLQKGWPTLLKVARV